MTTTTDEVVPAALQGALKLAGGEATLADLAAALLPPADSSPAPEAAPEVPQAQPLTAEVIAALGQVAGLFGRVQPKVLRALTAAERTALMQEQETIRLITAALAGREEQIKELIRHHIDLQDGSAPLDPRGHRILCSAQNPFRVAAPGCAQEWSQEYKAGKSEPSAAELQEALAAGEIDRETFLGFTRAVRVLDPGKARDYIRRNPAKGLAALKRITRRGAASTSMHLRKPR